MAVTDAIPGMSYMNAVDTNVSRYSLDVDEPVKQTKAKGVAAGPHGSNSDDASLTWQVAGELLRWLRKWEAAGRVSVPTSYIISATSLRCFRSSFLVRRCSCAIL